MAVKELILGRDAAAHHQGNGQQRLKEMEQINA
jgi:hypothetical protein